ncbi:hypothetical protein J3459_013091 [Metarhizium acridum]|uniref:uncharacterized protein n=1 Tax=Metarhizium acridum TaxID=92637 RepID=UPI001C6D1860|nr:hypothetical protein J3458_012310 [Metarhizium acridum]KAG8416959.1 hypothetical protein J3459_013091 [Metarhizium acridum]
MLRLALLPVQARVRHVEDEGLATGNFLTIRMSGAFVGLGLSSSIFNTLFSTPIYGAAAELTGALAPLKDTCDAVKFIGELRPLDVSASTLDQILRVYLKPFQAIFYTVAGLGGLGLVTSMFLDEIELRRKALGNQRFED